VPGFDKRLWRFEATSDTDERAAALTYISPDGEEGFPGELSARVNFTLIAADTLAIDYWATTDAPTPVNLTHHLYFNLSGDHRSPVLDHTLAIASGAITPVRPDLIPTGELMPVEGTSFDLRAPRPMGEALAEAHPQLTLARGFDHNWALEAGAEPAVRLRCPRTGVSLAMTTDQPGLQVYSGQGLGPPFAPFSGLALEPQGFPNAVNTPSFPTVVLRPGEIYRRRCLYRLGVGRAG
jgi:aldose 1-epimerase